MIKEDWNAYFKAKIHQNKLIGIHIKIMISKMLKVQKSTFKILSKIIKRKVKYNHNLCTKMLLKMKKIFNIFSQFKIFKTKIQFKLRNL